MSQFWFFLLILQVFILESRTDKIKWNCGERGVFRGTISGKPKDPWERQTLILDILTIKVIIFSLVRASRLIYKIQPEYGVK